MYFILDSQNRIAGQIRNPELYEEGSPYGDLSQFQVNGQSLLEITEQEADTVLQGNFNQWNAENMQWQISNAFDDMKIKAMKDATVFYNDRNQFLYNGVHYTISRPARISLYTRVTMLLVQLGGCENGSLKFPYRLDGDFSQAPSIPHTELKSILEKVECYDTQIEEVLNQHLTQIELIQDSLQLQQYDYTTKYPNILEIQPQN